MNNEEYNEEEDVQFEPEGEDVAFDDESGVKDKLKALREQLKECQNEKQEYLTGWQRAQADYVNLKKETDAEKLRISERIKAGLVEDFLPVLDSFEMAFGNKEAWESVDQNWRVGVEYIYNQFMTVLQESGMEPIADTDVPFDPKLHQSVEVVPTDDQSLDHTVAQVVQKGYRQGDQTVRAARVVIREYKE